MLKKITILFLLQISFSLCGIAQGGKDLEIIKETNKVALVIGNSNYHNGFNQLDSPKNDAKGMGEALKRLGFRLVENKVHIDVSYQRMEELVSKFSDEIRQGGVGLFYFSGHGSQNNERNNFLIPVDTKIASQSDLKYKAMNVEFITDKMEESKNKLNILILDACRNNPLPSGTKSGGKGLNTSPVEGVYIAFAARDGQTAADGSLNGYSLYTEKLLQNIETPNQRLEDLFIKTRKAVKDETQNRQFPIDYGSVDGVFYFNFDSTLPFSNSPTNISSDRIKEAREFFILGLNCSSTDYDCKISNYTKAINLNPNDAEAYYWRGCTYRDKQNHDQAIQDYTKAIQLNPNYQDAYFWRGRSYYQKQNYQKAVSDLTIYVELAPNSRSGYLTRALSYEILGEKAKAEADRKKAKELEGKP